ncbi:uncharacterized protein FOBCDRAFT_277492 [Fusarium oxysporum Fo47]|jgi:hypothetical protein|uniref:Uncharacterized protein n=1 Tax=Fusarium oxysporum Fo47 TaxID=660027 RepID=W9J850_FUSOX|nr:uncharacterized protein FOBCDRAFT_277492 [Fusarium oxysporum Fo47]EWZ28041.1 hypothetical protein FOZG_18243 [Fusarium oxysporum Fo47]QKD57857.1 hypothetical protein FOBCDRAFT_277492 [Fusarium oxysporum Fo47]
MMQHILYLLGQLQLGRDDNISGSLDIEECESGGEDWCDDCDFASDSEDTDTDEDFDEGTDEDIDSEEDEELDKDQQTSYSRSDFSLPTGYWLRLPEVLFQLSMMFWTHEDPAGNMSSSVIVYYTAVIGIQRRSLAFNSVHNSTSELAALIWVGRLLFLEYVLPV